jgi:hypothetical protein
MLMIYPNPANHQPQADRAPGAQTLQLDPPGRRPPQRSAARSAVAAAPGSATTTDQCVPEEGLTYEPAILRYAAIWGSDAEMSLHPCAITMVPPLALGVTV